MTSTDTRLTSQQVSGLSDNELSEAVARAIGLPVGEVRLWEGKPARPIPCVVTFWPTHLTYYGADVSDAFHWSPKSPAAVLHVMEHMRQHWASGRYSKVWSIRCDLEEVWRVSVNDENGTHRVISRLTSDEDYPGYAFGRGVFEAALLSIQEERT